MVTNASVAPNVQNAVTVSNEKLNILTIMEPSFFLQPTAPVTLAVASALPDVPKPSAARVLAMGVMEPSANVTRTSVHVTKLNNAVPESEQSTISKPLYYSIVTID